MVLWWEPNFLEPFYPKNHFLLKNQGTQPNPPIVKGDVKNMMGFLFEYTPRKVTWKIKHHPIEKSS